MTTVLIVLNIILIVIILLLLVAGKRGKNSVFSNLEDIELIEFQQNLKLLIDELHKVAETQIKEMDAGKKQVDDSVAVADARINELKYLIERNQLIRKSEYRAAITAGLSTDDVLFQDTRKKPAVEPPRKSIPPQSKFVMNDKQPENSGGNIDFEPGHEEHKPKNKYDHINNLLKNGLSIEEIAKVTGLSRGEIELIKNIKR